jgi:hypothetical protein
MNPRTSALAAVLALCFAIPVRADDGDTPGGNPAPGIGLVNFANGDTLTGSVAGWDKEGLHWKGAFSADPVLLKPANPNMIDIRFPPRDAPAGAALADSDLLLANGDVLPGAVISLDDKTLLLQTWYAGKLAVPRDLVRRIVRSAVIYNGPNALEEWSIATTLAHQSTWTCVDGVLNTPGYGAIGRDIKLPPLARIEFDLAFPPGNSSTTTIHICADRVPDPRVSYIFQLSPNGTIDFAKYFRETPNIRIGQPVSLHPATPQQEWVAQMMQMNPNARQERGRMEPQKIHFEIRIDKHTKSIWLYADGKMLEQYSGLDDIASMGSGLVFSSGAPDSPLSIAKIKVFPWSGGPGFPEDAAAAGGDELQLLNGDALHGRLESIAGGKVLFTSSGGALQIPLGDIEFIRIAGGEADAALSKTSVDAPGAVRLHFLVRGGVTAEIESWDAKGVTAASPDFGRAVFLPGAFRRVEFNPGSRPAQEGGDALDSGGGGADD